LEDQKRCLLGAADDRQVSCPRAQAAVDRVSDIYEQDPPDGTWVFRGSDGRFREGALYLSRTRDDGEQ